MNKFLLFFSALALLTSCGGGGGGGSGGSNSNTVGARILHGAIEAAPVDLVSSTQGLIQTVKFAEDKGYANLDSGTQLLNLYRTKDVSTSIFTRQINNEKGLKNTIVFYGDRGNFGLRANLISEQKPDVPRGFADIRIIHAAVGAGNLEAQISSNQVIAGFGSASTYASIAPGPITIQILRSADKVLVDSVLFTAEEGKAYSIFVAGEIGYLVISKVLEEN